jgi:hypothetical protein
MLMVIWLPMSGEMDTGSAQMAAGPIPEWALGPTVADGVSVILQDGKPEALGRK